MILTTKRRKIRNYKRHAVVKIRHIRGRSHERLEWEKYEWEKENFIKSFKRWSHFKGTFPIIKQDKVLFLFRLVYVCCGNERKC